MPPSPPQPHHLLQPRPYPSKFSLVVPMYNEEAVVPLFRDAVNKFLAGIPCAAEVVVVNDGSTDATLEGLAAWAADDGRLKILHLSRNFGHQIALTCGLDHAEGDAVAIVDADLQDPLPVVHQMIDRYREGYDVAYGQRVSRAGESAGKRFTAWAFYRIARLLIYRDLPIDSGDFRLISRDCLNGLRQMRETHRFLRGMVAWVGYPQIAVPYERQPRAAGSTKYPFRKMLAFAWTASVSFSTVPLRCTILTGAVVGLFGLEEAVRALLANIFNWYPVPGWTSLMVVTAVVGSAILTSIGILGEYIARLYEQSKQRPLYMVARTFNVEPNDAPSVTPSRTDAISPLR